MQLFYSVVSCIGMSALLMLEYIVKKSDTIVPSNKRFFRLSIWTVVVVMAAEIITTVFENAPVSYRPLHIWGNVLGFSLSPFVPLLIGEAIDGSHKKSLFAFVAVPVINLVLTVFSVWFPLIFRVSDENGYERGEVFWLYTLSYTVGLVYLLFQTFFITREYQGNNRCIPVVLFLFVCLGTVGQVLVPQLHVSWLCVAFSIALYYIYYCDLMHQIDGLTGLLNRRAYEYYIRRFRGGKGAAVVLFDVDDFKSINDRYGHPFGDYCLTTVSVCIRRAFFKIGLCFRIGGDEFCVLARKTDQAAVQKAYEKFLREIELMRRTESRLPMVSIGYSFADASSKGISVAVFEADQNMYQFKRKRKEAVPQ